MFSRRVSWFGLMLALGLMVVSSAVQPSFGAPKKEDPDDPPPLELGPGPEKDAPAAEIKPGVRAKAAAEDESEEPPAKTKAKRKKPSSNDPNSADYQPENTNRPGRDKLISEVERDLQALKAAGSVKRDDENDFFVVGTIDLQDHQATVDFPIHQGLRKMAEAVADFMLDKPAGGVRQWKAFGRAKNEKAALVLKKKAYDQSIEGKLEAFKLTKSGKKTVDDYFVVGTAEVFTATQHADVRFKVTGGTKDTASYLLDFILSATERAKRQWHVFFRAKTQEEADTYIAQLRNWYDSMESQRSQIAQIYQAKTTRRC